MDTQTFQFTLVTTEGTTYTYTGNLASLYRHLQSNEGTRVVEEKTQFAE